MKLRESSFIDLSMWAMVVLVCMVVGGICCCHDKKYDYPGYPGLPPQTNDSSTAYEPIIVPEE